MIKWIHGGLIYQIDMVMFDLVDQIYCMSVTCFKIVDHWRRDAGNRIGIEATPLSIFIGETAHIKKLKQEGYNESQISKAIYDSSYNYLIYALTKRNKNLVYYLQGATTLMSDRIEYEDALKILEIAPNQVPLVTKFNAY